jgi:hypothetical protein
MALPNSAAYRQSNSFLAGTFIPNGSTVAYAPAYAGGGATGAVFPNLGAGYGSTTWRNGVEIGGTANGSSNQAIYYTIYSDTYTQGTTTQPNALPVVWGVTTGNSTTDILNLVNKLPAMYPTTKHTTYAQAVTWLNTGGYFLANRNYPAIMYNESTPMISAFDPSFSASYPLTGTAIKDLTGNATSAGTLQGSASWDSTDKNSILLPTSSSIALPQNIFSNYVLESNSANRLTFSVWFYLTTLPGTNLIATLFNLTDNRAGTTNRPGAIPQSTECWMALYVNSAGEIRLEGDPQCSGAAVTTASKLTTTPVTTGSWHNITFTADFTTTNSNIKVCYDGVIGGTVTYIWPVSGPVANTPNGVGLLGCSATNSTGIILNGTGMNGKIGASYIYYDEINDTQKADLYSKTLPIYP